MPLFMADHDIKDGGRFEEEHARGGGANHLARFHQRPGLPDHLLEPLLMFCKGFQYGGFKLLTARLADIKSVGLFFPVGFAVGGKPGSQKIRYKIKYRKKQTPGCTTRSR